MRRSLVLLSFAAAAPASAMTVAEFLGKADGLYAKGFAALFSPDIGLLKAEGIAATKEWRAQARAPVACPPPGKVPLSQNEFMAMMRAVPPEKRASMTVAQAITQPLNRRYPCK